MFNTVLATPACRQTGPNSKGFPANIMDKTAIAWLPPLFCGVFTTLLLHHRNCYSTPVLVVIISPPAARCAQRHGSGSRRPRQHRTTHSMAAGRSTRCPMETYKGLTPVRVRTTAPITSPSSVKGAQEPASLPGSSALPQSRDLAHPMLGMSSSSPRCAASPKRRG